MYCTCTVLCKFAVSALINSSWLVNFKITLNFKSRLTAELSKVGRSDHRSVGDCVADDQITCDTHPAHETWLHSILLYSLTSIFARLYICNTSIIATLLSPPPLVSRSLYLQFLHYCT